MENERESANILPCTAELHRWNSPADKNYDTRFRLNAQCASAAKSMDFPKRLFFLLSLFFFPPVEYNPACFYAIPLMHFESIAQSVGRNDELVARVLCRNLREWCGSSGPMICIPKDRMNDFGARYCLNAFAALNSWKMKFEVSSQTRLAITGRSWCVSFLIWNK